MPRPGALIGRSCNRARRSGDFERELRRRVMKELELVLGDMRFVEKGWVLKTSSGKTARSANRAKYLGERPS